jgi:predicted RNA polymerase sigma factor
VGGFSVCGIARAFLADEAAIAQPLVRAKRQIRDRRLTLDMPHGAELRERLDSVLDVLVGGYWTAEIPPEQASLILERT